MSPRRFAITAAALCGTVILAGCVIAAVAGFGLADIKDTHAAPIENRSASPLSVDAGPVNAPRAIAMGKAVVSNADVVLAAAAVMGIGRSGEAEAIAEAALPDSSQMLVPEKSPPQIATVGAPEPVHTDHTEPVSSSKTLDGSLPDTSQTLAPETPSVQIATLGAPETVHTEHIERVNSNKTLDQCLAQDVCIDQYLWSVYQRTPKFDTVKVVERRKVTVKINSKPRTVIKEFTKLIDEDFTWKDPKAAEKAGMSLMEYVIGGMDQGFRLRLYRALRALDDAGLSPGITSAFRDDYRQSLTSGLKAATDRSYHGGTFRGGYGHGLAADLVSVKGETRAERLMSSENLWRWIDAHGKEFGIGRPYLDKDPPHVAPIDGTEYTDHRRDTNTQHARSEIKKCSLHAVRNDHGVAKRAARSLKVLRSI
jgi:hypothetical protein